MLEECCAVLRDDASRGKCSESQGMQQAVPVNAQQWFYFCNVGGMLAG